MKASLRPPALREMRWQDLPAVVALEQRSYPQTAWSEHTWWTELAARPHRVYLIHSGSGASGEVAGYAGLNISGGEVADVMTITVDEASRGAGIGTTLLQGLHEQAINRGARQILLEVRADNESAQRLYIRSGYKAISRRRGYFQPDGVDAIVLRADLTAGLDTDGGV